MDIGNQSGETVIYVADNGGGIENDVLEEAIRKAGELGEWCRDDARVCSGRLRNGEDHEDKLSDSDRPIRLRYVHRADDRILLDEDDLSPTATAVLIRPVTDAYKLRVRD